PFGIEPKPAQVRFQDASILGRSLGKLGTVFLAAHPVLSSTGARPMATIVLVHGIEHQRETPDLIEASWLPALAGGVRLAGRADLADRLWPPRSRPHSINCRATYYGDLFRSPDRQGPGDDLRDLTPDQAKLAEVLSLEGLERMAESAPAGS